MRWALTFGVAALGITSGCHAVSGLDDFSEAGGSATAGMGGFGGSPSAGGGGTGGVGEGGMGGVAGNGGMGGDGGAPIPVSCKETSAPTGVKTIDPDGENGNDPIEVFCNHDLVDGGWLLVGHSVLSGSGNIGWKEDTGDPTDLRSTYSLDVAQNNITFDTVLLRSRESTDQLYLISNVPTDFLTAYENSAWDARNDIEWIQGPCSGGGDGIPDRLMWMGWTNKNDTFWFRDQATDDQNYGLHNDEWSFGDNACGESGGLDEEQGQIYVRNSAQ